MCNSMKSGKIATKEHKLTKLSMVSKKESTRIRLIESTRMYFNECAPRKCFIQFYYWRIVRVHQEHIHICAMFQASHHNLVVSTSEFGSEYIKFSLGRFKKILFMAHSRKHERSTKLDYEMEQNLNEKRERKVNKKYTTIKNACCSFTVSGGDDELGLLLRN